MKTVTNEELQLYAREMLFHNDRIVLVQNPITTAIWAMPLALIRA